MQLVPKAAGLQTPLQRDKEPLIHVLLPRKVHSGDINMIQIILFKNKRQHSCWRLSCFNMSTGGLMVEEHLGQVWLDVCLPFLDSTWRDLESYEYEDHTKIIRILHVLFVDG